MQLALRMVERRCAMPTVGFTYAIVVLSTVIRSSDRWIAASVSLSTAEVASSKIKMGGFFKTARATPTQSVVFVHQITFVLFPLQLRF